MQNKQVYVPSLEAKELYCHMVRNTNVKFNYCGMIPYSLELIKLRKEGLLTKKVKITGKEQSDDIINVKFNQKVKSGIQLIEMLEIKIQTVKDENYKDKLIKFIEIIKSEQTHDKWREVTNNDLRRELYNNGFYIREINEKTGEFKDTKYVVYKRSSSKSRTGQCLFIKEHLYDTMINWSRLGLPFKKNEEVDYASLLAYESLVGSSLESLVCIKPKNILIVDDVDSKFKKEFNVVQTGDNGLLDSVAKEVEISNSLFDGESLLDKEYFKENQSMMLLRNHMFKSAAFNCNIQEFLRDNCPSHTVYDEWKIKNMFNEYILAKDIKLIITPSSLKALKFHKVIGTEKDIWNHWKGVVKKEGSYFGVCKHEKKSKRGYDDNGNILQQTSYQMLNSLPMRDGEINEILFYEKEFVNKLKNNDDFFIDHITNSANEMNSNLMLADLYKTNKKIVHTKFFRDFRKAEIKSYLTYVKRGKVRLNGDYCVMLGNPLEFLHHSIGNLDITTCQISTNEGESVPPLLSGNEIFTTLFSFGKKLTGFRNPHTSPSNVLIAQNTYVKEIDAYFNLTSNIVCVNAISFEIQDILSGCDYDSDTLVLFDNAKLLELAEKCFGKYNVCINKVESQKKKYKLNNQDMCEIDNQLSTSQRNIGKVVNLGQFCMSTYWDILSRKGDQDVLDELMKKVDVLTVLSGICIDLAKKFYEIDIDKEVSYISKNKSLGKMKPNFWKYISQSKTIKNRITEYNCPMDYLYKEMSNIPYADHRKNIEFNSLLVKYDYKNGNRKQQKKIIEYVEDMCLKINSINANTGHTVDERNNLIDDTIKYFNFKLQKLTVKTDTMYAILLNLIKNNSKIATKLLNILYITQKDTLIKAFKTQ